MRRPTYFLASLKLLFILASVPVVTGQVKARTFRAKPGSFIQFQMCHACAYANWQKETVVALRTAIEAFVSQDSSAHYTEQRYWVLPSLAAAQRNFKEKFRGAEHPAVFVEHGACPFECCTYREWWASEPTPVFASPSLSAARVKMLKKGEHVRALTGFVRTRAGRSSSLATTGDIALVLRSGYFRIAARASS